MAENSEISWPADSVERRSVDSLIPYARNARTHSEAQVEQLAASIREWGWTVPVLVDETSGIIAGHGRVLAAKQLGLEEVPVIVARGWTEVQKQAYVLADNKLAENAGWDEGLLRVEIESLQALEFDMAVFGFSDDEIAELFAFEDGTAGNTDPDAAPEAGAIAVSRVGDLWELGPHRVLCGTVLAGLELERLLGDDKADAVWTDPPYNVAYGSTLAGGIQNDDMSAEDFAAFLHTAMKNTAAAMKPGAAVYVAHSETEGGTFRDAFLAAPLKLSSCLIWVKSEFVLGRADYQWKHEPVLYGWKPGRAHKWYGGRKETSIRELEDTSVFSFNEDGSVVVTVGGQSLLITGDNLVAKPLETTLVPVPKPRRSAEHPTMKPIGLVARMLKNSAREGDVVLDPFGGSGSTLIACETHGFRGRLLEIDPKFVDVIVRRWQEFTGQQAILDGDGRTFAEVAKAKGLDDEAGPEAEAEPPESGDRESGPAADQRERATA